MKNPPYFEGITHGAARRSPTSRARASWRELGDSITTDHISPGRLASARPRPAGDYLLERQVLQKDFNSYGARRGNHES